ncbi:zinc transporter ZntB [Halioxenophilus aromaticivorans]|uniref:Zinc transporter ZntB n=1 Tax=Halioxenophilus aromaticivorans TaxID=1306992 RepID=A0AAV3TXK7_9ALTE
MEQDPALVFYKTLDGRGGCRAYEELPDQAESYQTWVHIDANAVNAKALFHQSLPSVDQHTVAAMFDVDARPRVLSTDFGLLLILRGINHNEGDKPEDMVGVRIFVVENKIVSLHYRRSKALMQVAQSLDDGKGPATIAGILSQISSLLIDYIEASIEQLDDQLDQLETEVLESPGPTLRHDIAEVRKTSIRIRRYLAPQREALNHLRNIELHGITDNVRRALQEVHDSQTRALETLDAIRERSQVVTDELINALSEKLNRNLYVLSVITAIFLPLGFLTGLFGINVGGLPGVDNDNAFVYFSLFLGAVTALQLLIFKLFKWF